jgi:hypothetical protein
MGQDKAIALAIIGKAQLTLWLPNRNPDGRTQSLTTGPESDTLRYLDGTDSSMNQIHLVFKSFPVFLPLTSEFIHSRKESVLKFLKEKTIS